MIRDVTIVLKLQSIPAVVTMIARGDSRTMITELEKLPEARARRVTPDLIVVEEKEVP